jgi:hypothetical protein
VNNCIGARNHKNFIVFINLTTILGFLYLYVFQTIVLQNLEDKYAISDSDKSFINLHTKILPFVFGPCILLPPTSLLVIPYGIKVLVVYNRAFFG